MAIAFVLLFHAFFERIPQSNLEYSVRKLTAPLWCGVNIFFVLSGFLITGILIDTRHRARYFRSFYARRTLRIFPLYFATLAMAFVLLPALHLLPRTPFFEQLPALTYTYNWSAAAGYQVPGLTHLWSLSVEEQFYLVWPVIIYLVPPRRLPTVLITLLALSFLFRLTLYFTGQLFTYAYFITPSRVEDLCFGGLAAWLVRNPAPLERVSRRIPAIAGAALLLFAVSVVAGHGFEANKWPALLYGVTAVCTLAALTVLKSTTEPQNRWWGVPPLRWLGTYSYGIYVLHQPILNFTNSRLKDTAFLTYSAGMLAGVAISCFAGWVSYHGFERYFLRLKQRFATTAL